MIVVFSSNERGAMIQMSVKITETLLGMEMKTKCFIPSIANGNIPDKVKPFVVRYKKDKSINPYNSAVKLVAKNIMELKPKFLLYIDNGVFSSQVAINLAGCVKQALIMHDAGTSHSSFDTSIKHRIKSYIEKKTSEICNKKVDWVITCSPNSKDIFCNLYPSLKNKTYMLPLGAHMPEGNSITPLEIENISNYYLFFGKIDKYKGLDILLRSYSQWIGKRYLVIAGNGKLQSYEVMMVKKDSRVVLINRYIKDEEMIYLFANARAIILPYKDATQSGILPIAYMCGKPVICSDVIGITQFVEDGRTGLICSSDESFIQAYNKMEDDVLLEQMSINTRQFYENKLEWKNNIIKMLNIFNIQ